MTRQHFKGNKYTDELIIERASDKGFKVVSINKEDRVIPYVFLECNHGHKRESQADDLQSLRCLFCEGNRLTVKGVQELVGGEGFSLVEEPTQSIDKYGNSFVKKSTVLKVVCLEGHEKLIRVADFNRGKRCSTCSGTIMNAGFSRSEEIIAKALTYLDISFERQKSTGPAFEELALDFFLPEHKMIIEYDGLHHKYGRSDSTDEQLEDIQRKDAVRDDYARHIGFKMVRIDGEEGGKSLVYALANILKEYIRVDTSDPYYDNIVREVFDYCADEFGWLTYDDIKRNADMRLAHTLPEVHEITGEATSVIARHFKWIYGMTKQDYIKCKDLGVAR